MTELESLKEARNLGFKTVAVITNQSVAVDERNIDEVIFDVSNDLLDDILDHMDEYYFEIVGNIIVRKLNYVIRPLYALFKERW